MTLPFLIVLIALAAAGTAALLWYSRTQHGFFMLREVRRSLRRAAYTCSRRLNGAMRRDTGPL